MFDAMQGKIENRVNMLIPQEIILQHYCNKLPLGFPENLISGNAGLICSPQKGPTLITAHLPKVLDWLHEQDKPLVLEQEPCGVPVLLYDQEFSTERILFHYDGTPASANLIRNFISLFSENIKRSKATIISPSFIPKSKQREEQELIQLVSNATAETSFIKFNFNRIGDFWSYAVKNECTLLVTTKNHQAELAKVLFHFYKGGMWYDRLSFYISL
ncbi:hypothetical protein P872_17485 [Rhodonellum psychrophilum GCM71 = DSM 17998]|uniref:Uncharacterized protein n=3 Tax=Cytophagaceae TaxID=89373 RepID=U5BZZ5_9BACT|nr:hypothetical protein P872_17485 [Rhodonellum psychrophilum GCM71 = DSM 17998]SDY98581.1 hypothetical protein SAMN05444412_104186 [Rhodonellum ikkaensis]